MPRLATYVGLVDHAEQVLAESLRTVAEAQAKHPDIHFMCETLAKMSDAHREELAPVVERYGEDDASEPERLHAAGLGEARTGPLGLLRDLQDLHVLAHLVLSSWTVIRQGAQGLRDRELLEVAEASAAETRRQIAWLQTRMKVAAPQALIVSP
ncbi:hypothetical protein [Phycicoccus sp. Soil748]|uniref:hypothetical protein n=1 Tax=Intrasporangiaceae TaxID=85021 RepID=UPI0007025D88|nr:hypothetical protein [Phycicoccus sp. Soil748]KRE52540.1 hypothetical protein ASG70_14185 [Phycicoccus sp. Soil748]